MARDSFIFYRSFYESIKELPEDNQLKVYKAISNYALNQEEIELDGISKAIFSLIKPQLDANYKKYENGKQNKNKTEAKRKQNKSKIETNVNDNENVNVNDNVTTTVVNNASDSCIDGLQKVIDFYNENIGGLTPFGLELLTQYVNELNVDIVIYAMQISVEANKRTIQYIKAILNNWEKAGIKTVVDAQNEVSNFKKKKNKKDSNFEQREYGDLSYLYTNIYANEGVENGM